MTITSLMNQLNPKIFDIIMDQYVFNDLLLKDRNKPIKIEINFMNNFHGKGKNAYPKFEYILTNFNDSLLSKAEIAEHLYLHYKYFDIDDDCIEYVILKIYI